MELDENRNVRERDQQKQHTLLLEQLDQPETQCSRLGLSSKSLLQ